MNPIFGGRNKLTRWLRSGLNEPSAICVQRIYLNKVMRLNSTEFFVCFILFFITFML